MPRFLVYTGVFGDYDRVYPPVRPEAEIDYVIVTDDPELRVPGWRTHVVDAKKFSSARAANRYYKALIHRELPGYRAALYVDANIRLLGRTSEVIASFLKTGATLGVFRHSMRNTVAAEIDACLTTNKVSDPDALRRQWKDYVDAGFPDDQGLIEATIMVRNHEAPDLDAAMTLWWELFDRYQTRDQIGLPFVKWKTGVSCYYLPGSFRDPNPYFAVYPHHAASDVRPYYAHVAARSHDSLGHKLLLHGWHASWKLRRSLRRMRGTLPL